MTDFTLHTIETASDKAKPLLTQSQEAFGMIPNLHAVMAEAPTVLEAYQKLHELAEKTSFDARELTVVWQTINVEHGCHYCVPAHTAIAKSMQIEDKIIEALRNQTPLPIAKLEQLRETTLAIVRQRGDVNEYVLDAFYEAGYSKQNLLEILLIVAQKTMSNYLNHIAETPLDKPFEAYSWQKP